IALPFRDYQAASDSFARAAELEPDRHEPHLLHAFALERHKYGDAAAQAYERALAPRENAPEAIYGLAELYASQLNQSEKAKECFERYLALGSDLPRTEKARVRLQLVEGRIAAGAEEAARLAREEEERRKEPERR